MSDHPTPPRTAEWPSHLPTTLTGPTTDVTISGHGQVLDPDDHILDVLIARTAGDDNSLLLTTHSEVHGAVILGDRIRIRTQPRYPASETTAPIQHCELTSFLDVIVLTFVSTVTATWPRRLRIDIDGGLGVVCHDGGDEDAHPVGSRVLVRGVVGEPHINTIRMAQIRHLSDVPEFADMDEVTLLAVEALATDGWPGSVADLAALARATTS